jgi:hypothetical protein
MAVGREWLCGREEREEMERDEARAGSVDHLTHTCHWCGFVIFIFKLQLQCIHLVLQPLLSLRIKWLSTFRPAAVHLFTSQCTRGPLVSKTASRDTRGKDKHISK